MFTHCQVSQAILKLVCYHVIHCMLYLESTAFLTNQQDKAVNQFSSSLIRSVLFQMEFKLNLIFINIQFVTVYKSIISWINEFSVCTYYRSVVVLSTTHCEGRGSIDQYILIKTPRPQMPVIKNLNRRNRLYLFNCWSVRTNRLQILHAIGNALGDSPELYCKTLLLKMPHT